MNLLPDQLMFILGGGPAGLAAAIAFAKGMDCLVIEALSPLIDKGCGEGLMPDALASLRSAGHRNLRIAWPCVSRDSLLQRGAFCGRYLSKWERNRRPQTKLHQRMIERATEVGVRLALEYAREGAGRTFALDRRKGNQVRLADWSRWAKLFRSSMGRS